MANEQDVRTVGYLCHIFGAKAVLDAVLTGRIARKCFRPCYVALLALTLRAKIQPHMFLSIRVLLLTLPPVVLLHNTTQMKYTHKWGKKDVANKKMKLDVGLTHSILPDSQGALGFTLSASLMVSQKPGRAGFSPPFIPVLTGARTMALFFASTAVQKKAPSGRFFLELESDYRAA
jgi:hypothetical protein